MSIFDSHCHPQVAQYDKDRDAMISRSKASGISMICVGTDLETSKLGIKLAQEHKNMWATVGLHPNDNLNEDFNPLEYEELLKMPKVVAMGEIGLDYYRTSEPKDQKFQTERFEYQLEVAKKMKKPVILHCRDSKAGSTGKAYPQMVDILKNLNITNGVVHSYTGSLEEAKKFLNLGFYLGFNGIITFPPSRKASAGTVPGMYDEIVRYAPLEQILLETDSPYLTPEPYRGKRNEPAYVVEVAKKVSELKKEPLEKVVEITTKNCKNLFKI